MFYFPILEKAAFSSSLILDWSDSKRTSNAYRKLDSNKCVLPSEPPTSMGPVQHPLLDSCSSRFYEALLF